MKKSPYALFIRLSRPIFLMGGLLQFTLGAGMARYLGFTIDWGIFLFGLTWVISLQLTVHYLNEYFDSPADALNETRTWFSGGSGVLGKDENKLPRSVALHSSYVTLTAIALLTYGLLRADRMPPQVALVSILLFLGAILYSLPPARLSHSGFGELTAAVVLGNLVPAFGFVLQTGELHRLLALGTFSLTSLYIAFLVIVELPDYANDVKFEKRNFLVRMGWENGIILHNYAVLVGFGLLGAAMIFGLPIGIALPAFLPLPLGLLQIWYLRRITLGAKPNWNALGLNAVMLVGGVGYLLGFAFWTR